MLGSFLYRKAFCFGGLLSSVDFCRLAYGSVGFVRGLFVGGF